MNVTGSGDYVMGTMHHNYGEEQGVRITPRTYTIRILLEESSIITSNYRRKKWYTIVYYNDLQQHLFSGDFLCYGTCKS